MQQNKYNAYIKAFFISFITGAIFVVPYTILNGGFFYLGSDFVEQQVIFWQHCNEAIKTGDIWWTQSMDLGNGFIQSFSFYVIGSPFFWVSLLFSPDKIYSLMGLFLLVKMGVAGLTSYIYIRQYASEKSALICSVLYAFSGYQISNMNFFHFYDVTALAPLILLALDLGMKKDNKYFFGIMVFLLLSTNSVLFVGIAVFVILYFIVKLVCKEYILNKERFISLAIQTIVGIMAAGVILIPTIYSLLSNPRISEAGYDSVLNMIIIKPIYIAEFVRALLMPAECIFDKGFFMQGFTNAPELFLPVFSIVLVMAYYFNNKKTWISKLLVVSLIFAFVPVLNSAFSLFNPEYYTRWYFMPILIMALSSAISLDNKDISLKKGYWAYIALWGLFALIAVWFIFYFKVTFVYNIVIAGVFFIVSVLGFIITLNIRKIQSFKYGLSFLLLCVILCSAATGMINTYYHSRGRKAEDVLNYNTINSQVELEKSDTGYRIGSDYYFMNIGIALNNATVTNFSSTIHGSAFEFYNAMGIARSVISMPGEDLKPVLNFLSVQYWVSLEKYSPSISIESTINTEIQGNYKISEYENYIPMGFTYDKYVLKDDFDELSFENKQYALLKAIILDEDQAQKYSGLLQEISKEELLDISLYEEDIKNRQEISAHYFEYTNDGARAAITLDKENLILFSIPYEEGFRAIVNGRNVEIEKVSNGFIGIKGEVGDNEIELIYRPQGFYLGFALTVIAIIICLIFIVKAIIKLKKTKISKQY